MKVDIEISRMEEKQTPYTQDNKKQHEESKQGSNQT